MPSLSSAVCLKCEEIYDSTTRKICSGALCSHSICEPCFDQKKSSTCPTCGKPDSYATKNINYQAMELLDRLKENMSLKVIAEVISDLESLSKGPCCECTNHCDKLRLCVSCSLESNLLSKSENGDIKMTTETNGELLETKILRLKNSAFCANCVLDNNLHMGHSTVLVKDNTIHKTLGLLNTANDLSKLGPADYQQITEILESGTLQPILDVFKSDMNNTEKEETFQDLMTMAKDIKRTIPFKIPPQYEKYADLAGSCFNAFFR
ncbi:hypothetical protein L3Y34_003461 [Caenorhabditis briggsae]|uniref:RING-type domain-containing protein n=1 Tax=Caenorhabditis briggsae TaxID=6238 RepID=A0AAE9ADB3_CAEBR|nr:hypothetical protein L3Y34_003461 [Caenorhabditis briggsae]